MGDPVVTLHDKQDMFCNIPDRLGQGEFLKRPNYMWSETEVGRKATQNQKSETTNLVANDQKRQQVK